MSMATKTAISPVVKALDFAASLLVVPPALALKAYRARMSLFPRTTRRLKALGVYPIRDHYYEPLFDETALLRPLAQPRELPGIDFNIDGQIDFLRTLRRGDEIEHMRIDRPASDGEAFALGNGNFESGDAEFLYQFIRATKPSTVVEIGSGHSTKLARLALARNRAECGQTTRHICVEPYEFGWLEALGDVEIRRSRIERLEFDWANELKAGDLLFVDSSHIIRPQGDVLTEYLDIFPRLSSGVFVHIHDVFLPRDYLHSWIVDDVRFWNEQYLLEALLSNTSRYEIVAALNMLKHDRYEEMAAVCPYLTPEREPGSFYMRVR